MALPDAMPPAATLRDARDIIAKWSSSDLLDQISSLPEIPPIPVPRAEQAARTQEPPSTAADTSKATSTPEESTAEPSPERSKPVTQAIDSDIESPPGGLKRLESNVSDTAPPKTNSAETTDIKPVPQGKPQPHPPRAAKPPAEIRVKPPKMGFVSPPPKEETPEATVAEQAQSVAKEISRKRRLQKRNEQRRKQRNRKASAAADNKGSNAVKRKFRVDSPGAEPEEAAPTEDSRNVAGGRIQSNSPKGGQRHRIDGGERVDETLNTADSRMRTHSRPRQRFIDEPHGSNLRGPHFQVTAPKRSNLTSMTGQFLAYIGVLGLTVGTAMVIYGHFGDHAQVTPTGWLVTTVAQMMLFLGVINLVSGGMEQTNNDVSARINHLGEQLMRIEQVAEEAVRGPKIDPRRYADPDEYAEEPERETVVQHERR